MNGQVNAPGLTPGELRAIREQAVGAALGTVLGAVTAARQPATSATASTGGPLTGPQVLSALMLLRELRTEMAGWEPELIDAARQLGTSWADLAPALGVASRQAAERRYLRLRPSADAGTSTGEQRVTAERDKRAGDRAARDWARDNAAGLRQLAGQISALTDLPRGAAGDLAALRDALGTDDAADLIKPLAEARPHLEAGHPALAAQLDAVEDHADELRRETLRRRHAAD
ncbi:DUF3156 family protein [Catenulispora yoronensis]|uniref:DUF3156 family protein n=2 Tax=Catenulispora yoronensis TaxID=450799 RepID=A0ABN2VNR1_9ACTN